MRAPHCIHQVETERDDTFFCRHPKVRSKGNLVDAAVCIVCEWRNQPCEEKRDVPVDPLSATPPPPLQRLWNLTQSFVDFAADGMKTLTEEQFRVRLEVCDSCDQRRENWCAKCGCYLSIKARGRAFKCPLDKWPVMADE